MTRIPLFFPLLVAAAPALADVSDAGNACIDVLRANGTPDAQGGEVLSDEFSEAGSLVMLKDAGGTVWRCIAYGDGTVGELEVVDAADDGEGAMDGASAPMVSGEQRVKFASGTSGTVLTATLAPGAAVRYLLGAEKDQFLNMYVKVYNGALAYQIFNPDGSALLDTIGAGTPYSGQLWQSGDHAIEVYNDGTEPVTFDIGMSIY